MINKFEGEKFIEKRTKYDADLFALERAWQYLTYWQRKKLAFRFRVEVVRVASRKKFEALRAVIVSAVCRAGMAAACVCDLLSMSGMNVIYSLLFLLVFSVR